MANLHYKTYETYLEALTESFISEFFTNHPEYEKEIDAMVEQNIDVDQKYIFHFLNSGLDPQIGMEKMIDAMISNYRYSADYIYLLKHFIDAGASLYNLTEKLFFIPDVAYDWIEEAIYENGIDVRAAIIDKYAQHLNQDYIKNYANWTEIQATLWEEAEDDIDPKLVFLQHYKYMSKYIKSL
jgi:hypothetical protein